MSIRVAFRALVLTGVISCGGYDDVSGLAPSPPMTLTFEPSSAVQKGTRTTSGFFRCDADMSILAHGSSDHRISLKEVATTFYDAGGVQSNTVHASPLDWFGVITMKRDDTAVAHRQPTGSGPFTLLTELAYADQFGTSKVATFTLKCVE